MVENRGQVLKDSGQLAGRDLERHDRPDVLGMHTQVLLRQNCNVITALSPARKMKAKTLSVVGPQQSEGGM